MYYKDVSDPYREWTLEDRKDAWSENDRAGCRRYDEDRDSGERAYERWRSGGEFSDPNPDGRFH